MTLISAALVAYGAVAASATAVREAPRFARWYRRVHNM
jgi:hypothetical protein